MAVLLFAMTTAVMGCYQKDPDPIEAPSGTSKVEVTPIPTVNRQAELADAKSKNPDAVAWLYIPGTEVDDPVMQAEDVGFDYIDPNPMGSKLTEFFQTVEKKNWLDIDGVTFSEGDSFLTLPPAAGSTTRPTAAISGLGSWQSCCRRLAFTRLKGRWFGGDCGSLC